MRAMACAARLPEDFSSRRRVAECAWASCAGRCGAAAIRVRARDKTALSGRRPVRRRVARSAGPSPAAGVYGGRHDRRTARRATATAAGTRTAGIELAATPSPSARTTTRTTCASARWSPATRSGSRRAPGFDEHPHRDTEIVTWVVEGELTHRDSTRATSPCVRPGDVQRLSAARRGPARRAQRRRRPAALRPDVAGPAGRRAATRRTRSCAASPTPPPTRCPRPAPCCTCAGWRRASAPPSRTRPYVYVHVVRGEVRLGGEELGPGDAARITDAKARTRGRARPAELLMWEMAVG